MSVTLNEILQNLYGVKTSPRLNYTTDDIDSSVKAIVNNNPNRVSMIIVNLGANACYISPFRDVSSTKGIYIAPNGGSVVLQWDKDFELVGYEWHGVSSVDNQSVLILENISI